VKKIEKGGAFFEKEKRGARGGELEPRGRGGRKDWGGEKTSWQAAKGWKDLGKKAQQFYQVTSS